MPKNYEERAVVARKFINKYFDNDSQITAEELQVIDTGILIRFTCKVVLQEVEFVNLLDRVRSSIDTLRKIIGLDYDEISIEISNVKYVFNLLNDPNEVD